MMRLRVQLYKQKNSFDIMQLFFIFAVHLNPNASYQTCMKIKKIPLTKFPEIPFLSLHFLKFRAQVRVTKFLLTYKFCRGFSNEQI